MKVKTINLTINKKFDAWLESITDETVRGLVKKNSVLTGGAIASMLLREPVNDFDFYFRDMETAKAVAEYYVAQFKLSPPPSFKNGKEVEIFVKVTTPPAPKPKDEIGIIGEPQPEPEPDRVRIYIKSAGVAAEEEEGTYQYFESQPPEAAEEYANKVLEAKNEKEEKPDFRPVFLSDNAISLSGDIQLVIRFYGVPEKIHQNYDYVHATNYWTSWDRKVTLRAEALECLLTKELRYIGSKYPICSLIRARKFIQREWTINAGQYLKIAMQINELNLKDFDVLREQLVGMDVAYFMQVLAELKKKDAAKIETAYLIEIIDRIFG
jgi:hypothetical protein